MTALARLLALITLLVMAGCGNEPAPADPVDRPTARATGFTHQPCADLVIVAVRGQQQSPDKNVGAGTEVYRLVYELARLVQRDTNTTVRLESIDYRSNPAPDLSAYDDAVDAGAASLDRRIDQLEDACPDSTLAIAGFSMGAQVVHEAMADRKTGQVGVVAMLADPMRSPTANYEQDSFGVAAPHPGSLGPGPEFGALADRTITFCAPADDVCSHSPGTSRTAVDSVHKHFYEKPAHVKAIAKRTYGVLQRSGF